MKVLPAIDLREGACVQLVGGEYADERVRLTDVPAVARRWAELGFSRVHVVDLDAATGQGDNRETIALLTRTPGLSVQVGGGVRDEARVQELLSLGASSVVVGTRAIEEPAWLQSMTKRFPSRLVVAADVRGDEVVTRGWKHRTGLPLGALLETLSALDLAGVLVTAVHVEGQQGGTDLEVMARARRATRHPLIASGGVTTVDDVRALAALNLDAAVIGMALYTGRLDAAALPLEFK